MVVTLLTEDGKSPGDQLEAINAALTQLDNEANNVQGFLGAESVRLAHISDPAGGATQDAEARTAINAILVVLESFGATETS